MKMESCTTRMALRPSFLLLLQVSAFVAESSVGEIDSESQWGLARLSTGDDRLNVACGDEMVGECGGEEEMSMGYSEVSRRSLEKASDFISYGALIRDKIPCSRRGHSYYDCQKHKAVNPYRRGCSVITRCARIIH